MFTCESVTCKFKYYVSCMLYAVWMFRISDIQVSLEHLIAVLLANCRALISGKCQSLLQAVAGQELQGETAETSYSLPNSTKYCRETNKKKRNQSSFWVEHHRVIFTEHLSLLHGNTWLHHQPLLYCVYMYFVYVCVSLHFLCLCL